MKYERHKHVLGSAALPHILRIWAHDMIPRCMEVFVLDVYVGEVYSIIPSANYKVIYHASTSAVLLSCMLAPWRRHVVYYGVVCNTLTTAVYFAKYNIVATVGKPACNMPQVLRTIQQTAKVTLSNRRAAFDTQLPSGVHVSQQTPIAAQASFCTVYATPQNANRIQSAHFEASQEHTLPSINI